MIDETNLCPLIWLGTRIDYRQAWFVQDKFARARSDGLIKDTLLMLEHGPVYTAGRRTSPHHKLKERLSAPLVLTDRGGQMTYHGPGQLVAYPIINLRDRGLGPRSYVSTLENAIIDALMVFGIDGFVEPGMTGVWVPEGKIAAIGIKISRGVSTHGMALNVHTDLNAYDEIIPCGMIGSRTTSISEIRPDLPVRDDSLPQLVRRAFAEAIGARLGISWVATSIDDVFVDKVSCPK
jgi:lipoate-protein ligase B